MALLLAGAAAPSPGPSWGEASVEVPAGWEQAGISTEGYAMDLDPSGGRGESSCLRIRGASGATGFLGAMQSLESWPYGGRRMRLAAWVRTADVAAGAHLFLRVRDRDRRRIVFDNMESRPIRGSTGWTLHQVVLDVPEEAAELAFGVFLRGRGTVWADDFTLTSVGLAVPVTATGPGPPASPSPPLPNDFPPAAPGSDWLLGGTAPGDYAVELEPSGGRDGSAAAVLRSTAESPAGFVALFRGIETGEHRGRRLRLSAWVEATEVTGRAGLWMRVDGEAHRQILAFDNMGSRPIRGTFGWRRHEVVLDVSESARRIYYGALLRGPGRIRVDDFRLEPVSPEVPTTDLLAPGSSRPVNLDFDHPPTAGPEPAGRR